MATALKNNKLVFLLFIFIFIEIGFLTFFKNGLGQYVSPIVWMLGAFGTCAVGLKLYGNGQEVEDSPVFIDKSKWFLCLIIFAVFAFGLTFQLSYLFEKYPVKAEISDIIPSLELYVKRFLAGDKVYAPLDFGSYEVLPTYFPLLWLPYCFSELLEIDYRWTAYLVFLLGVAIYYVRLFSQSNSTTALIVKATFPFILLTTLIYGPGADANFGMSVELLPVGFYLILCSTILNRSYFVMGIGILLCLMSRYAFTFWLPVYFLVIWFVRGFPVGFKTGMVALVGVIFIYIIPFFAKDPTILTNGLKYYAKTAETQWVTQYWQKPGEVPFHLKQGLSFSIFFYEFTNGDSNERLTKNRKVHLAACAIAALLVLLGFFYYWNQGMNLKIYMVVALKFYLTIFYGFFYVPFSYLFLLPLFLSIPIVYGLSLDSKKAATS